MALEHLLKVELATDKLRLIGRAGGGCINDGCSYETDTGKVFIKTNSKSEAKLMFDGEVASLQTIRSTNTVRVPRPIKSLANPSGGAVLIMEHLDMHSLNRHQKMLGERIAALHLHNQHVGDELKKHKGTIGKGVGQEDVQYVEKFGFYTTTCCGYIPQANDWQQEWPTFFINQRLQPQLDLIERDYGDREVHQLWSQVQSKIPVLFEGMTIRPSLLHGDLWGGNVAETSEGAVVFDPASFYGHSEFELAIAGMFGGFGHNFYDAYHSLIPKSPGFEKRMKLYRLFNYLNHWNHFGTGYKGSTLSTMRSLLS
uniref:ketosamine-3-kinase-like isoform X2 n=1 Tax=Myxine glutinosa TaxID=7769 RepID=UPI00358E8330